MIKSLLADNSDIKIEANQREIAECYGIHKATAQHRPRLYQTFAMDGLSYFIDYYNTRRCQHNLDCQSPAMYKDGT